MHTQRTLEIPYIGGVLCAERTDEHTEMFPEEESAAVLWSSDKECAERCNELLQSHEMRRNLRAGGRARVLELKLGNEAVCRQIIEEVQR